MSRRLVAAFLALFFLTQTALATAPAVPPIADLDRYQSFNIVSSTASVDLTFPLFGDCTDLVVTLNGAVLGPSLWTCVSISGQPLNQIALPIQDGRILFNPSIASGLLEITYSWHQRTGTLGTSPGINRREFNLDYTQVVASLRELRYLYNKIAASALGTLAPIANGSLLANISGGTAAPVAVSGSSFLAFFGVANPTVAATKVANYTADTTNCKQTVPLGGNAQFTLTVPAASGFPAACEIYVVNVDAFGSGRGKKMAINGVAWPHQVLYPGMSFTLRNVNSSWQVFGLPARVKIPGGTFNLFTDFANGNDANDGLAAGAGNAKKTVQACLDTITADLDLSAWAGTSGEPSSQSLTVCNMLVGSVDTNGVHWSPHSLVGAQGGAAVMVKGNGGQATISGGGTIDAFGCFLRCSLQIQNVIFLATGGGHSDLTVGYYGDVEILSGVTFGSSPGGSHISTSDHAIVRLSSSYTISGNAAEHFLVQGQSQITTQGLPTLVTGGSQAFSVAFADVSGGQISVNGMTFSGMGGATGQRYNASALGSINTGGGGANFFPGNSAGTVNCTTGGATIGNCGIYN